MKRIWNSVSFLIILVLLPLQAGATEYLVPVGKVIGLQLQDRTVTVAAYDDVFGSCAREAGLKIGDALLKINAHPIGCVDDVRAALDSSAGDISLTVRRSGRTHTLQVTPRQTDDGPRLGIYLRQGIAGIGTVTWYDPESGNFGTLGHGVSNAKGGILTMSGGQAYDAEVNSVQKGKCGEPGQLKGSAQSLRVCGTLLRNTPQGVFGHTKEGWPGKPIPVAAFENVHTGNATIRSTIQGACTQEYSVEILKIYPKDRSDGRNFLLRVTDPTLLSKTGGIVQGMSGSPIIQDGKLVGAVTHVLVNDPTRGYGIFIENMLAAAG